LILVKWYYVVCLGKGERMARQIWKKRENETSQQYRAFQCYYLQDPAVRSIKNAIAEYQKASGKQDVEGHNSRFNYWSAQHDWVLRAEAWDEHRFEAREKAALRGTEKGAEKQAVNLEAMRAELAEKFHEIGSDADKLLEEIMKNPESVKLSEVNGLQRVRLDLFRALSKGEGSGGADQNAAIEAEIGKW
jgi:hypothetical protein